MGVFDSFGDFLSAVSSLLPNSEYVSLNTIEKLIKDIDQSFVPELQLKGVSYDRASNKSLGFNGDGSDYVVIAPSRLLVEGEGKDKKASLEIRNNRTNTMTTSQQTFINVLDKGLSLTPAGVGPVLIDMATLFPKEVYFDPNSPPEHPPDTDGSIIKKFNEFLSRPELKNKKVIIRLIAGDQNAPWQDLEAECSRIFLGQEQGRKVSKLSHPNLELYIGLYAPTFDPKYLTLP